MIYDSDELRQIAARGLRDDGELSGSEVEALCAVLPELLNAAAERDRLRARVDELARALRPFAEAAKCISNKPLPLGIRDACSVLIPDGWLRNAAAALGADDGK